MIQPQKLKVTTQKYREAFKQLIAALENKFEIILVFYRQEMESAQIVQSLVDFENDFWAICLQQRFAIVFNKYNRALQILETAIDMKLRRGWESHNIVNEALCLRYQDGVNTPEVTLNTRNHIILGEGDRALAFNVFEFQPLKPLQLASIKYTAALLHSCKSNLDIGATLCLETLELLIDSGEKNHPLTISCWEMLGDIYQQMGYHQYHQAYTYYQLAIESAAINLGAANPRTLTLLKAIANLAYNQGEFDTAQYLTPRCQANFEISDFTQTPAAAKRLNHLGFSLCQQGYYTASAHILQHALQINRQVLPSLHLNTAATLHNFATLHKTMGNYNTACLLFEQALEIRQQFSEHTDTATTLNSLGVLYSWMRKYSRAKPLFQQALKICLTHLGEQHPHTAVTLNNLARIYVYQGELILAKPLFRRSLSILQQVYGKEHPYTKVVEKNFTQGDERS